MDPNAYSYGDAETDSDFEADSNSRADFGVDSGADSDTGPTMQNRFQTFLKLSRIVSDENFIPPITNTMIVTKPFMKLSLRVTNTNTNRGHQDDDATLKQKVQYGCFVFLVCGFVSITEYRFGVTLCVCVLRYIYYLLWG